MITTSREEYEWREWKASPGDTISGFLFENDILEKQNVFKEWLGFGKKDLRKWVVLIAGRNNIVKGTGDEFDYPLKANQVYLMPYKVVRVEEVIFQQDHPLVFGGYGYKPEKNPDLLISLSI